MNSKIGPSNLFYGLPIYGGTKERLLGALESHLESESEKSLLTIATPNPEQMVLAWEDIKFARALSSADILLPDGQGISWAIKRKWRMENGKWKMKDPAKFSILNSQFSILQRVAGREVFHDLLEMAVRKHWKVFLLGGKPNSARSIVSFYNLQPTTYNLEWDYDEGSRMNAGDALKKISKLQPDILFVAYGAPWQEEWIADHREELEKSGVRLAMVVGGAFEYEAGLVPRVPDVFAHAHLEWLWRLITEPWRWRRQLKGLQFFLHVLLSPES